MIGEQANLHYHQGQIILLLYTGVVIICIIFLALAIFDITNAFRMID